MVQQSPEEQMGRNRESVLMEGREGHDVAIGRCRLLLATGHEPLRCVGPPAKKTALDEALYARWVTSKRYHDSIGLMLSKKEQVLSNS